MIAAAALVVGDWGTSRLRLFLCDADGKVLDTLSGPGAAEARDRFAEVFDRLLADWTQRHGRLPAVLCGMVGSSFGWVQAPYLACPARPEKIAGSCLELRGGYVRIVPGLSCRNRLDAPDLMRGEETQVLGALQLVPALRRGQHLLCLPGTHTKWVLLDEGAVHEFLTAPTGEIFAALRDHSVLVHDGDVDATNPEGPGFSEALEQFRKFPDAGLLHRVFECRSRRLTGVMPAQAAAPFLSGLLVASDVHGARRLLSVPGMAPTVQLVGASGLTRLYAMALTSQGVESREVDGAAASLAGLVHLNSLLPQGVVALAN